MIVLRTLSLVVVALCLAPALRAQVRVDFDALPEGTNAPTFVTPAATFQDLVLDGAGTIGTFVVDNASATLAGKPRFSSPNVLVPGGFSAGPTLASVPVKSFRILLAQPTNWIRFGIYVDTLGNNNTLQVDFLHAGQFVGGMTVFGIGFPTWDANVGENCNSAMPIDEVRVHGFGPVDGGRFRCAIDTLVVTDAPCSASQHVCMASVVGGCPCTQPMTISSGGCVHSLGLAADVDASGMASVSLDETVLYLSSLPSGSTGILVQSNGLTNPAPFGDGILCLTSPLMRVLSCTEQGGGYAQYPLPGQLPIAVRAGLTTPGTRWYQFVYRNAASFCTPSTFNVTNGIAIFWAP